MSEPGRGWRLACPLLLIVAAGVSAAVFTDYGITWDEGVQSTYGELVLDYFVSGGSDVRANEYSNLYYYGPLFETFAAACYRVVGDWKYEIRHAAIGLTALLTLVAVWRYGRLLGHPAVALFALLAMGMQPRWIGHAFNNSKDIPFACGFAWAMFAIARLLAGNRWRWTDATLCGVAIGVALSFRIGGLMLFGLLAAGTVASLVFSSDERSAWRRQPLDRARKLTTIVVVAWTTMVAGWPWTHGGPLMRPIAALVEMSGFRFSYTTFFAGQFVASNQLPRHYLPQYLAIVTPPAILALALWGLAHSIRLQRARPSVALLLVQLWLLAPVALVVATRPNVYDGIRHFLFVLPALALCCGLGAASICASLGRRPLATAALVVLMLLPLPAIVRLHPYQSSYFNLLAGGVSRAWRHYDTDYWASSYREAMQWVLAQPAGDEPFAIAVACSETNRPCAEYYLDEAGVDPAKISMHCIWNGDEPMPANVRFYVGMLRYGKGATFFPSWPVVHRVGRAGATFSLIKRNPNAPAAD